MNKELRRTIIAGNWKMNMLTSGVRAYAGGLLPLITGFQKWCDTVVCTPFIMLAETLRAFKDSTVGIGAQNMSEHASGAFTGEVSGAQLADLGAQYVIIGHSERRELFGETDVTVNGKIQAALAVSLDPVICVGESLKQRETGITFEFVSMQIKAALFGIKADDMSRLVIAYEPIWAIGTGLTATPGDAQDVCRKIREVIGSLYGEKTAGSVPVLYGGSMNDKNAYDLLAKPDIDGGLIGGASLKPDTFAAIINAANQ